MACTFLRALREGAYDGRLSDRQRAIRLTEELLRRFPGAASPLLFSAPGRTELGGNHTDHQGGHVLCAAVEFDMMACAAVNASSVVRIYSAGYPDVTVDLRDLSPKEEEQGTSAALVRGVAAGVAALGYPLAGFDAVMDSRIPAGAGLSSSAAYEVLMGVIFDRFSCGGELDALDIAKIAQQAENRYFGKPCGLMDQVACALGGIAAIDFSDPLNPQADRIRCDFEKFGYSLCIVDTGSSHADLTADYAAIPAEMGSVAAFFDRKRLSQVPREEVLAHLAELRIRCGDRAVLRALHFYAEDRRALEEATALRSGDFSRFLELVRESGRSSAMFLQNVFSPSAPSCQPISLALSLGEQLLGDQGAIRVHGGGFAGTVQAFVPADRAEDFAREVEKLMPTCKCHILRIRPQGGCVVAG